MKQATSKGELALALISIGFMVFNFPFPYDPIPFKESITSPKSGGKGCVSDLCSDYFMGRSLLDPLTVHHFIALYVYTIFKTINVRTSVNTD